MSNPSLCRMCGDVLRHPPLLTYPNSPQSAQGFLNSLDEIDDVVDLDIYECQSCGLVQHLLPPVSYYRDVIRAVAYSPEMAEFRAIQLGDWIQKFNLSDKRILEIGSGRGEYLSLLQKSGARNVYGIEHSLESVGIAQSQDLEVLPGYLTSNFSNPWQKPFEAFAIFSFMEHWPDLNGSLKSLQGMLLDGALGLIEVPNFEFIFKNGLYSEFTTDHIYYFTNHTLRTALELNGFEVLSIQSVWHEYILSAQVRKRIPIETKVFGNKQQRIISELHSFTNRFDRKHIVVWGAGHQALAVMALAQLQGSVSHVVDSAEFKQQKYTPGTHLLIKSPDSLLVDKPRAIIIMAAAYSDEVARTISERYPFVGHIAILREEQLEVIKDDGSTVEAS